MNCLARKKTMEDVGPVHGRHRRFAEPIEAIPPILATRRNRTRGTGRISATRVVSSRYGVGPLQSGSSSANALCAASRVTAVQPLQRVVAVSRIARWITRSEEHTSELQSLMRISYAVFCLKKNKKQKSTTQEKTHTH